MKTGILTHWSVAVRWSHLNRTPEDGPSAPPAPHTLSGSPDGNIQSHCKTYGIFFSDLLKQSVFICSCVKTKQKKTTTPQSLV